MKRLVRAASLAAAGTGTALLLGATDLSRPLAENLWSRYQQAERVSDEIVVVTERPGATSFSYPPLIVLSLLEAISAGQPTAIVVTDVAPTPNFDELRQLLVYAQTSLVVPAIVTAAEIVDLSEQVPSAAISGPSTANPAGVAFSRPAGWRDRRLAPVLIQVPSEGGEVVPSAGLLAFLQARSLPLQLAMGDGQISAGNTTFPVEGTSGMRFSVADELLDPDDPHRVSSFDLLSRNVEVSRFADKVVFVGPSSAASARFVDSPTGEALPLVLYEANVANTLLTNDHLQLVPGWTELGLAAAAAVVVAMSAALLPLWFAALTWLATLGATAVTFHMLATSGRLLDPFLAAAAATVIFVVAVTSAVWRQGRERRHIRGLFSEYVPAAVVADLLDSGRGRIAAAGERLTVTVLFCDLCDFTPLSATISPSDVRVLLDEYYETLSAAVLDHGGTVLQYTGDEIFAVFGAPIPNTMHPENGLACAQEFLARRDQLTERLATHGLPSVEYGIGVHTGDVVAAHVGSTLRRQYTILGDTVNVCSRLCSLARHGELIYSQTTRDGCLNREESELLEGILLKGVSEARTLWRISQPRNVTNPMPLPMHSP